jgi:anti-sigma B factor antagonist
MTNTETVTIGNAPALAVDSELTIYHAAELKAPLLAAFGGEGDVVLELSRVGEADSAGLQLLLMMRAEAARRGRRLLLAGTSPAVQEILSTAGMSADFETTGAA